MRGFRLHVLAAICLALVGGACASVQVDHGNSATTGPARRLNFHTVLFGWIRISDPVNLSEHCPEGWSSVQTRVNVTGMLFRVVTAGLYTPWRVTVRCVQSSPRI